MTNFDTATKKAIGALCLGAVGVVAFALWFGHYYPTLFEIATKTAQFIFWFSAVAVGLFGIWKHFDENGERRTWERAKLSKELLDDLNGNPLALNAAYMLGAFRGRWYERQVKGQFTSFQVTQEQVARVLEPKRTPLTANEDYVRECYDNLLFHLELCFAAVESKLIDWQALKPMVLPLFADVERTLLLEPLKAYASFLGYHRVHTRLSGVIEEALTKPST